jgi:hypothetical protein
MEPGEGDPPAEKHVFKAPAPKKSLLGACHSLQGHAAAGITPRSGAAHGATRRRHARSPRMRRPRLLPPPSCPGLDVLAKQKRAERGEPEREQACRGPSTQGS